MAGLRRRCLNFGKGLPAIKNFVLRIAKYLGLFSISQWIYRKRLCILCYHGFSMTEEHRFRPQLFMNPDTFSRRLAYLSRNGYKVLPLEEALMRLEKNKSRLKEIIITIDDGFFSVLKYAAPELRRFSFPATLYVTTYYVKHPNPVYRLVLQYMFWKSKVIQLDLDELLPDVQDPILSGAHVLSNSLCDMLMEYGEQVLDEPGRIALLDKLGTMLAVPLSDLLASRALSLLTSDEITSLRNFGVDVQLHTHRHRFPPEDVELAEEIITNRAFLGSFTSAPLVHLCYPSGEWRREQWHVLAENDVLSATTCEIGLNNSTTPRLALRRFLDGENISDLEFAAEMSGFKQLLRDMRDIFHH